MSRFEPSFRRARRRGGLALRTLGTGAFVAASLVLAGPALPANAATNTFTVTTTTDITAGTCSATSCSLRQAIAAADAVGGTDKITFASSTNGRVFTLINGTLPVTGTQTLSVLGNGDTNTAISGNGIAQVLNIATGSTVTLSGLTIENGKGDLGGGISNSGTLAVNNSTLSGNTAPSGGGGIYNHGALTVTDSTLAANSTPSGGNASHGGGGIFNDGGTLTVANTTLSGNSATVGGGGIANSGTLTVTDSTLSGNSTGAGEDGAAILNIGTLTVTNSTLSGNSAGVGGAISNDGGTATVTNSTLSGNVGTTGAGAVNNGEGTLFITGSTLSSNSTPGDGGGISSVGEVGFANGLVTVTDSTLSGNIGTDDGGAIFIIQGALTVTDSTISGNSTNVDGGGILIEPSTTATVSNSTLSGNSAKIDGGGIWNGGMLAVTDTVVANSPNSNCFGAPSDGGHNLEDDAGASCGFAAAQADIVGQNPKLGPLANNGGPTPTEALLTGSPAIGAGAMCSVATDQRGVERKDPCDVGAYETAGAGDGLSIAQPDITSTTSAGASGGPVSFAPTVTDPDDTSPPPLSCKTAAGMTVTSGATFRVGTTTVTCTASDPDDTPSSASITFTVTVKTSSSAPLPTTPLPTTPLPTTPLGTSPPVTGAPVTGSPNGPAPALAVTGVNSAETASVALGLVAVGGLLAGLARRRHRSGGAA